MTKNNLNIAPTTMGAITKGKVWTLLKKDFSGKELRSDKAKTNPIESSKKRVYGKTL